MWRQLVIWSLIAGLAYVSGNPCDTTHASSCYTDLVHYEGISFPLYGEDEFKLEETCGHINASFECIETYAENCHESPECDDTCRALVRDIQGFTRNTGLRSLANELCDVYSALRETYLENYPCLEHNKDGYAACHNDSQMSQEYLSTIKGEEAISATCCFFTWYHDCFTNITRDTCSANATFFVSFSIHKLIGHISSQLCKSNQVSCERPPLPTEAGDDTDLDKDKSNEIDNDIDNSINDKQSFASITSVSLGVVMLSYIFTVLSKKIYCE